MTPASGMRGYAHTVDKSGRVSRSAAIVQSLLAVPVLAIILVLAESVARTGIIITLGATTFIVFATPHSVVAQPRRVIGGHALGVLSGLLCYYLLKSTVRDGPDLLLWLTGAVAVGVATFLMILTRTGHPPAASTAICLVVSEWSLQTISLVMAGAVCLAVVGWLLRYRLVDLG